MINENSERLSGFRPGNTEEDTKPSVMLVYLMQEEMIYTSEAGASQNNVPHTQNQTHHRTSKANMKKDQKKTSELTWNGSLDGSLAFLHFLLNLHPPSVPPTDASQPGPPPDVRGQLSERSPPRPAEGSSSPAGPVPARTLSDISPFLT